MNQYLSGILTILEQNLLAILEQNLEPKVVILMVEKA